MTVPYAARWWGVTRQSVQRVANELAASGLVAFLDNPDHRTSPLVALTDEGRRILEAITARARIANEEVAAGTTDDELRAARAFLKRLTAEIHRLDPGR